MASLLGKADQTLVKGAFAVAESNIPGDMSQIYEQRAANIKALTEGIQSAWDKRNGEEDAQHEWLENSRSETLTNITTGKTNDALMEVTNFVTKDMRTRLQPYKKGSLEYKKIESEAARLVAISGKNNEIFNSLMNSKLLARGSGNAKKLYALMINDYNNNTNETNVQYNGDGDYKYTLPGTNFSMTLGQIDTEIGKLDTAGPSNVMTALTKLKGNVTKRPWDDSYARDFRNEISSSLDAPNDRKNIMHYDGFPGMKFSFYEGLTGKDPKMQEQIFDILDKINVLDIDGVGGADTREELLTYANPENGYLLTQAIASSPQGKDMLLDFIINSAASDIYKQGENEIDYQKSQEEKNNRSGSGIRTTTKQTTKNEKVKGSLNYIDQFGDSKTIKASTVYGIQDRMNNIMGNKKRENAIIKVSGQSYHWSKGSWRKVDRDSGKYYFVDDEGGKLMTKEDARVFSTIQQVFDEHGLEVLPGSSGGASTSGKGKYD